MVAACGNPDKSVNTDSKIALAKIDTLLPDPVVVAANRTGEYLPGLKGEKGGDSGEPDKRYFQRGKSQPGGQGQRGNNERA